MGSISDKKRVVHQTIDQSRTQLNISVDDSKPLNQTQDLKTIKEVRAPDQVSSTLAKRKG